MSTKGAALMIRKYSFRERLRLVRRGHLRLAWRGFEFYVEQPGWKWRDPADPHPTKIVGQVLYSGNLDVPRDGADKA